MSKEIWDMLYVFYLIPNRRVYATVNLSDQAIVEFRMAKNINGFYLLDNNKNEGIIYE